MEKRKKRQSIEFFKVRRAGGSCAITLSRDVLDALELEVGDSIRYIISDDGEVRIEKKVTEIDFEEITKSATNQYIDLLDSLTKK